MLFWCPSRAGRRERLQERRMRCACVVLAAGLVGVSGGVVRGQAFTRATATSGISYVQNTSPPVGQLLPTESDYIITTGAAAARDYDGDGWVDLVVSRYDATPILYRNVADALVPGGRKFMDVTAGSGLDVGGAAGRINGLGWADVNNDGRVDLFATTKSNRHSLFINQGNGQFVDEAESRGVALPLNGAVHGGMSPSFGDYDRDGYLDIAVGSWGMGNAESNSGFQLLRNRGAADPGKFDVVTMTTGFANLTALRRWAFTPRFTDLDNDGWADIAMSSDFGNGRVFWNNQDGTFTVNEGEAGVGAETSAMGNTVGDFDRDGDLDWYVSSIAGSRLYRNRTIRPGQVGTARTFSDASTLGATGVSSGGWGWGTSFLDYDLDGWQDLVGTNGMTYPFSSYDNDRTQLWRNTGGAGTVGFTELGLTNGVNDIEDGKGLVVFDYDNDGAPDVFIVNNASGPVLYRNLLAGTNGYLKLRLFGVMSNADAVGAWVTVSDAQLGADLVQEVSASSNFLGQNDLSLLFGLGQLGGTIDRITIRWPSGFVQEFTNVTPGASYRVLEGYGVLLPMATVPEPGMILWGMLGVAGCVLRRRRESLRTGLERSLR